MTPEAKLRLYADRCNLQAQDVEYVLSLFGEVAAAQRETCAKIADDMTPADQSDYRHRGAAEACGRIARAIRARGKSS